METNETNFDLSGLGLIGKDLERLKKKLAYSKSGLEPNSQGVFEVDPTVSFDIQDLAEKYPNWKLTTYIVDSEEYKKAMADEMNARRTSNNPAHFTKDGKLKFINIFDILEAGDYVAIGQDAYLSTIWLMWKNRQQIKTGDYKATKISKLLSHSGEKGKVDSGVYVDVVSIPKSAWETLRDYFLETVSEDGDRRIDRLMYNGVESADFNRWLIEVEANTKNESSEDRLDRERALLEAYKPIVQDIEDDLTGLYVKDIPALLDRDQLSEVDYQREIAFLSYLMEKAYEIDGIYASGRELMMVTYLDCPSFEEYVEYCASVKGEK